MCPPRTFARGVAHRLCLQPLERCGNRQRQCQRRQRQMDRDVDQPRGPPWIERIGRRHPTRRKPACRRRDEHQEQGCEQRWHRETDERDAAIQRGGRSPAAAGEDAQRDAEGRGGHERDDRKGGGVRRGASDQAPHGAVVEERFAEIQAQRTRDPDGPLLRRAAIEIEPRAGHGDLAGARKRSKLRGDVPRRQPRQQERGRRDDENEYRRKK